VTLSREEMQKLEQEIERLEAAWRDAQQHATAAEAEVQRLQTRLHEAEQEIRGLDQTRQDRQNACTQAQVVLATAEERLRALQQRHEQLDRDSRQRRLEQDQNEQAQGECKQRLQISQLAMLRASSHLGQAYLDKESTQSQVAAMIAQRDVQRQERARLVQLSQTVRGEWRTQQERFHGLELAVNDLRHQRDTLVDRLHEDYQIDLAEMSRAHQAPLPSGERGETRRRAEDDAPETKSPPLDPAAANEEIAELRKKLARLGSVNMEALQELHDLETRAIDLRTQFDDLTAAKKSLEDIISKINQDSRRLFIETFQAVRVHFQELFRKLFGGGMADVVLEDENDVLECGIEIVARPPGKELRSISLLSGGEKTLTAVALLLAIFRSKPSPFCVLDEVDAALDEANIGRFTAVLREFLEHSQFIIVTHSKKTMASADVLYGITMQESGVSKQVTIRFEDWVEEPKAEVA
jgi:chromosome segregation protein